MRQMYERNIFSLNTPILKLTEQQNIIICYIFGYSKLFFFYSCPFSSNTCCYAAAPSGTWQGNRSVARAQHAPEIGEAWFTWLSFNLLVPHLFLHCKSTVCFISILLKEHGPNARKSCISAFEEKNRTIYLY